jgi:hypothetical protein
MDGKTKTAVLSALALGLAALALMFTLLKDVSQERQWQAINENARLLEVRKAASRATNKRITDLERSEFRTTINLEELTQLIQELAVSTGELTKILNVALSNANRIQDLEEGHNVVHKRSDEFDNRQNEA